MSLEQLERHRRLWRDKPVLRGVYGVWFDKLLAHEADLCRAQLRDRGLRNHARW